MAALPAGCLHAFASPYSVPCTKHTDDLTAVLLLVDLHNVLTWLVHTEGSGGC